MAEKRAERDQQRRKDLAFAQQMIKDSNVAVVLQAREQEVRLIQRKINSKAKNSPTVMFIIELTVEKIIVMNNLYKISDRCAKW